MVVSCRYTILYLPNPHATPRPRLSRLYTWAPRYAPLPGPTSVGLRPPRPPGPPTGGRARRVPGVTPLAAPQRNRLRTEDPRASLILASGASTDFLENNKLCIKRYMGRCQDFGTHGYPFLADKSTRHRCGACGRAGKTDTSRGSLELDGCPSNKHLPKVVDSWRQSTSRNRPSCCLNKHLQAAISVEINPNTSAHCHLPQQQQQSPLRLLVFYLPNLQAPHRPGLSCICTWFPRSTPHPGPTTDGPGGFNQYLEDLFMSSSCSCFISSSCCAYEKSCNTNDCLWVKSVT